jgi:4-hydroxy-2-oxoheptanedioate aldolase
MIHNTFKQWLQERRQPVPLGTWAMSASDACAEALAYVGFDFMVIDMEHVPLEMVDAIGLLRTLAGTPMGKSQPIVRLAWNDPILVKRILDGGAQTIMFPFIQNEQEAEQAVRSTKYIKDGNNGFRGVAAVHRASLYGAIPDYLQVANESIAVILQIETLQALSRLDKIAKVPGVDAIFIGPGDISANMGYLGQVGHAEVQKVLQDAARQCKALNVPCGIVGATPEMVRRYVDWGYDFVAIGSDMSMLTSKARENIALVRATDTPTQANMSNSAY